MPRKYHPCKRGKIRQYSDEQLREAMEIVYSGAMSARQASQHFGIPRATLGDYLLGKSLIGSTKQGRPQAIPVSIEDKIVKSATKASQLGIGLSVKQLLHRTGTLCRRLNLRTPFTNNTPGLDWWRGLKTRYPKLTIREPEKLGIQRARMLNRQKVEQYFEDLKRVTEELKIGDSPNNIWNCDEIGKTFEHSPVRVISVRGTRNVVSRTCSPSTHVTIMACGSAGGKRMPPLLIAKGKTNASLHGFNVEQAPEGTMWAVQENGWMTDDIGERWFEEVFLKNCGPARPQLLILDGHSSHESLSIIELAIAENIVLLSLPPHTTHYLQPLDRAIFGPLNHFYNEACTTYLSENPLNVISKATFTGLFKYAWDKGMTVSNIISGFIACGIYPLNKNAIPEEAFLPSEINTLAQHEMPLPTPSNLSTPATSLIPTSSNSVATMTSSDHTNIPFPITMSSSDSLSHYQSFPTSDQIHHISSKQITRAPVRFKPPFLQSAVSSFNAESHMTTSPAMSTMPPTSSQLTSTDVQPLASHTLSVSPIEVNFSSNKELTSDLLLDLVMRGEIQIATADEQGCASLPSLEEHSLVDLPSVDETINNIFMPNVGKRNDSQKFKANIVKSHRLLTSLDILNEKKRKAEKQKTKKKGLKL